MQHRIHDSVPGGPQQPDDRDPDPRDPDDVPPIPPDEPQPVPVQDPPAEPDQAPYIVSGRAAGQSPERAQIMNETAKGQRKERRGFASMSPEKQREIASKGGRAAHAKGTAHEWTSEEARSAGRKGGQISRGGRGRLMEPSDAVSEAPAPTSSPDLVSPDGQ